MFVKKSLRQKTSYIAAELLDSKRKNTSLLPWFICLKTCYLVTWTSKLCLENSKQKVKSYGKPETSIHLNRCLLVVFGIQNLFSTHSADALFVGTALAIMRTRLVYRTFTNSASGELILSIRIKPCFFWGQSLIFVQLSSTTFCGIPCTIFPCIWSDNSTKFLSTFFAHHPFAMIPSAPNTTLDLWFYAIVFQIIFEKKITNTSHIHTSTFTYVFTFTSALYFCMWIPITL